MRVAIVTDEEHPGLQPDDVGLPAAFGERGVEIETVAWGRRIPAGEFDLAVIRTPWDYFRRAGEFLAWVEGLGVPVVNPADVLRWNHDKRYLIELEEKGAARLPATRVLDGREREADVLLGELGVERAVVKPVVSAGAYRTRVIGRGDRIEWSDEDEGVFLVQEFVDAVQEKGEWSLSYFGGEFSHAVRKTAKAGDFRVQEEFGGGVLVEQPGEGLLREAERVLGAVPGEVVYARVDLVEVDGGRPVLMELELIEPELFFRCCEGAVGRFVDVVIGGLG